MPDPRIYIKLIQQCGRECPHFCRFETGKGPRYGCFADGKLPEKPIEMPLKTPFPKWCPLSTQEAPPDQTTYRPLDEPGSTERR